jgi:multimeric flavodoxin WrbA
MAKSVLGLSAGNPGGSAEILLKVALKAAEGAGGTVSLVRIDDLNLSLGPDAGADDADWFWDQLMESDALIVSTPIYTRTIPGKLRLLGDKISGPQADVAFTEEILRMRASGENIPVQFPIDERVLRPRVAGFIAVGGSIPSHWKTLALPLMHTLTASMQAAVVDQVQFAGAGSPSSIVLDPHALSRVAELGRNVAEQLGRTFEEAEYRGDAGACPVCHLDVVALMPNGTIECATCGAAGTMTVVDGTITTSFTAAGRDQSILSRAEKLAHFREVQDTAARHALRKGEIGGKASGYANWDDYLRP